MIQLESDTHAIARAIAALSDGEVIDHGTARAIAAGYNDFRTAHFVSTGYMPQSDAQWLMDALRRGVDAQTLKNAAPELTALMAYLLAREESGDTGRVDGWSDAWVVKHADYPHETDTLYDCPACNVEDDDTEESA